MRVDRRASLRVHSFSRWVSCGPYFGRAVSVFSGSRLTDLRGDTVVVLLARELGHEVRELASVLNLGLASLHLGRDEQARATLHDAVRLSRTLRYPECLVVCLEGLAAVIGLRPSVVDS